MQRKDYNRDQLLTDIRKLRESNSTEARCPNCDHLEARSNFSGRCSGEFKCRSCKTIWQQ